MLRVTPLALKIRENPHIQTKVGEEDTAIWRWCTILKKNAAKQTEKPTTPTHEFKQ